jgi:hypothetical protein
MDLISTEALDGLRTVLEQMMPASGNPALQPTLMFNTTRVSPLGLGSFVALNVDPAGSIYGRRIETGVAITVKAGNEDQLGNAVDDLTRQYLAQDRQTLVQNGLYRIQLQDLGPVTTVGRGNNAITTRDVNFNVLYEYLKFPDTAEGVLDEIPLDFDLDLSESGASFLINTGFDSNSLEMFDVVDDPLATQGAPSNWLYNAAEFRIEQRANIRGGGLTATPNKAGTYLLLKQTSKRPLVTNFILSAEMESEDPDGIGFVFRYQDTDNFYFYLMSSRHDYRLMGKKADGSFSMLDSGGLDETVGYDTNTSYHVKLIVQNNSFNMFINDEFALQGQDSSIVTAGRVGLACHANNRAYFSRIKVVKF